MSDLIYRQQAIDKFAHELCAEKTESGREYIISFRGIERILSELPSAEPEITRENILGWLLAYHTQSFELKGRYQAHEVIGWLIHDISTNLLENIASLEKGEQNE